MTRMQDGGGGEEKESSKRQAEFDLSVNEGRVKDCVAILRAEEVCDALELPSIPVHQNIVTPSSTPPRRHTLPI